MSSLGRWTYTSTLTIWPVASRDEYGQPVQGEPYTISGSWENGGSSQKDADGIEFIPESTYYFEAADGSDLIPSVGASIKRGDNTALPNPPSDAQEIKKVGGWDMSPFGNELPDWVIYT